MGGKVGRLGVGMAHLHITVLEGTVQGSAGKGSFAA